jgi:hypothetical protein
VSRLSHRTQAFGLLLALALPCAHAPGQVAAPTLRRAAAVPADAALRAVTEDTKLRLGLAAPEASRPGRRRLAASASVLGGAALGAWLGYFVSQVAMSDWEGTRAADRVPYRRRFAWSGAAVGAIGGYLLRPRGRTDGLGEPLGAYIYVPRTERDFIARAELQRAVALDALEAVQTLRPEWLNQAGAQGDAAREGGGEASAADSVVAVYVVNTRVGGVEALAEISIPEIEELRFYDPDDAQRRWGATHPRGAIEVVPLAPRAVP